MSARMRLGDFPVVDNHCHAIVSDHSALTLEGWAAMFTEADGAATRNRHVLTTVAFRRMVNELAVELEVEPRPERVFETRQSFDAEGWSRRLLGRAGISHLLLDDGYPPPPTFDPSEHAEFTGGAAHRVVRIEPIAERLLPEHETVDSLCAAMQAELGRALRAGAVAIKCAIAYRSGLAIRRWSSQDADAALAEMRPVEAGAPVRLNSAPVHDTLVHATLEVAAEHGVPVQFHVGYGDRDVDMRLGGPEHLRDVLEEPAYAGAPIVLLHQCYPFTRLGAWFAAVYDHVWLDLSYAIPFLSMGEMVACTRQALGVAPWSKLMVSSDAIKIPEFHWAGARMSRRALGRALTQLLDDGDLTMSDAEEAAHAILCGNAQELYRL